MKDLPLWAKIAVLVVLIIAGAVGGHIYLLAPKRVEIARKDEDLTKLKGENNKAALLEQRLPEFEAEVKRLEDRLAVLIQILPTSLETDVIVNKIKGIADNYHIQISNIDPKPLAAKGVYSEFAIGFKMRGTYHSLALFFDKLSKMDRIVNVPGVALRRIPGKDLSITVEADYTAVTYVYSG